MVLRLRTILSGTAATARTAFATLKTASGRDSLLGLPFETVLRKRHAMRAFLHRPELLPLKWVLIALGLIAVTVLSVIYLGKSMGRGTHFSTASVPLLGRRAVTIVPGLHLLGGLEPSAAYAVETGNGMVLVDSGLDADAQTSQISVECAWARLEPGAHRLPDPCARRPLRRSRYLHDVLGREGLRGTRRRGRLESGPPA